jgi:hypothetical protein
VPDYQVDHSTTLDVFLGRQGVQAWRIPVLVANGGALVSRNGSFITLAGPTTRLLGRDTVRVVDPPPTAVVNALQSAANSGARDYAIVPGTSPFDVKMAGVMDHRPSTIRLASTVADSLAGFVRALRTDSITAPIRHLIVCSHANPEGILFLKLDTLNAAHVTYQDLETAVTSRMLVVDGALLQPRPRDAAGPVAATFLVRGCRIGTAPVYLAKLKEALGNGLPVIAPLHFHIAAQQTRPPGFVEYMCYGFSLNRPQQLADKAAVVRAYQAGAFTRIDGRPVPARSWPDWVPRNPHAAAQQDVAATVLNPITNAREQIPGYFRFRARQLFPAQQSFALAADPGSDTGRKAAVRTELERVYRQYRSTYPFPEYVRFGYTTMAEFMDGWSWTFRYDSSTHTLFFAASRAEYTVMRPITDIATDRLFLNFYPSGPTGSVIELLAVSDTRFFATA